MVLSFHGLSDEVFFSFHIRFYIQSPKFNELWQYLINDMYAESRNDDCKYAQLATQEDFYRFQF